MMNTNSGYREVEHTADCALQIWASDLTNLFKLAAEGMNELAEIKLRGDDPIQRSIELDAHDNETLLVNFLSEILYYGEQEELGFDQFELMVWEGKLKAVCSGSRFLSRQKEIKAVTFHNLEIIENDGLFQVKIVFDV